MVTLSFTFRWINIQLVSKIALPNRFRNISQWLFRTLSLVDCSFWFGPLKSYTFSTIFKWFFLFVHPFVFSHLLGQLGLDVTLFSSFPHFPSLQHKFDVRSLKCGVILHSFFNTRVFVFYWVSLDLVPSHFASLVNLQITPPMWLLILRFCTLHILPDFLPFYKLVHMQIPRVPHSSIVSVMEPDFLATTLLQASLLLLFQTQRSIYR